MSSPEFNFANERAIQLVRNFGDNLAKHHAPEYNESAARKDYIDKFFIALGWDVNHDTQTNPYEQAVKVDCSVSVAARVKKADYAFFLKPISRRNCSKTKRRAPNSNSSPATAKRCSPRSRATSSAATPLSIAANE